VKVENKQLHDPPNHTPLFELIFQRIAKKGGKHPLIPFSEWMELALYHPEHGYYSCPRNRKLGREGDFFTSVSVGDTFGRLLSFQIEQVWREHYSDGKGEFVLIEQGAHDGQLARDILNGLAERKSPLADRIRYRIVEPRAEVRQQLREDFAKNPTGLSPEPDPVDSLDNARAECGIFLCNELLDSFPVRRLIFQDQQWREYGVGLNERGDSLAWRKAPLPAELHPFVEEIEEIGARAGEARGFPEGYTTEVCPCLRGWVEDCARLFRNGRWWVIDYGLESADYFSPLRSDGTLQCVRNHKTQDDPFSHIGDTDITAHVNLTHLIRLAEAAGLKLQQLTDQHHFLIQAARPWLLAIEADGNAGNRETASRLRQFQTLTHPAMMGQKFKVLEFSRSSASPIAN